MNIYQIHFFADIEKGPSQQDIFIQPNRMKISSTNVLHLHNIDPFGLDKINDVFFSFLVEVWQKISQTDMPAKIQIVRVDHEQSVPSLEIII